MVSSSSLYVKNPKRSDCAEMGLLGSEMGLVRQLNAALSTVDAISDASQAATSSQVDHVVMQILLPLFNTRLLIPAVRSAVLIRDASEWRKFASVEDIRQRLCDAVWALDTETQRLVLGDHDRLASRLEDLSERAKGEQMRSGLQSLSPAEFQRFAALNDEYEKKFGFNFICAVKGMNKDQILAEFERRITRSLEIEHQEGVEQFLKLMGFRLADMAQRAEEEEEQQQQQQQQEHGADKSRL